MTKSVFQIDAPKDRLFEIIADFNRWNEWFPGCKDAKIVTDKGATLQVELTLASVKTITMGLEFDLTPTQLINFRKYSGKDVKEYAGSFRLMNASDGAGTVVMGEMEMDAGAMVPKFKDAADPNIERVRRPDDLPLSRLPRALRALHQTHRIVSIPCASSACC